MNIFIFDLDLEKNAQQYCDKHLIKMILEHTQLLSTAVYHHMTPKTSPKSFKALTGLYLPTHINHPCAVWCRETKNNFLYLCRLTNRLIDEYHHRFGKIHKSLECLIHAESYHALFPEGPLTTFALAMPDLYKCSDPVKAYRDYFNGEKRHIMKWTNRAVPDWVRRW